MSEIRKINYGKRKICSYIKNDLIFYPENIKKMK